MITELLFEISESGTKGGLTEFHDYNSRVEKYNLDTCSSVLTEVLELWASIFKLNMLFKYQATKQRINLCYRFPHTVGIHLFIEWLKLCGQLEDILDGKQRGRINIKEVILHCVC